MTDLEELKRLAAKLDGYIAIPLAPPGEIDEEILPAVQAAILSLIQRVEEAEGLRHVVTMFTRDEEAACAVIPDHCKLELPDGGDVKLHEAIQRYALHSHAEGRLAGIEEAAEVLDKEADETYKCFVIHKERGSMTSMDKMEARSIAANNIARAIRALKDAAE